MGLSEMELQEIEQSLDRRHRDMGYSTWPANECRRLISALREAQQDVKRVDLLEKLASPYYESHAMYWGYSVGGKQGETVREAIDKKLARAAVDGRDEK